MSYRIFALTFILLLTRADADSLILSWSDPCIAELWSMLNFLATITLYCSMSGNARLQVWTDYNVLVTGRWYQCKQIPVEEKKIRLWSCSCISINDKINPETKHSYTLSFLAHYQKVYYTKIISRFSTKNDSTYSSLKSAESAHFMRVFCTFMYSMVVCAEK